jgi:hypothetical protein
LFHHARVLVARRSGWITAAGHSLAELKPAPMFEALWMQAPRSLLELLLEGRCQPVRRWAVQMIQRDRAAVASAVTVEELFGLLGHEDAEVAALASELLRDAPRLADLPLERWLALVESANPAALDVLCELMERHVDPRQLTLAQAVKLTASRPLPLARLGLEWLRSQTPRSDEDCQLVLGLVEAEAAPLRREIVGWARGVLASAPGFRPAWILEFLDSRHADVRAEGWAWFLAEPTTRDDVELWRRLLESPYDDVRLALVAELEARVQRGVRAPAEALELDPELLRLLWASVLLNVHRGGRAKPVVIRQLLRRLERRPEEVPRLLPLLAVALRSTRGPEWRAGLAAVVQLAEREPSARAAVASAFPELKWG